MLQLGAKVDEGGEGAIYEVIGRPDLVAKLYHAESHSAARDAKLRAMARTALFHDDERACWPITLLKRHGRIEGFSMSRLTPEWKPIIEAYNPTLWPKNITWQFHLRIARNVCTVTQSLHNDGIVICDVNERNVFVKDSAIVRFLDADSMQFTDDQDIVYCSPAWSERFRPPELAGRDLANTVRASDADCFSLAILVFHLVMLGRHPFGGRTKTTLAENMQRGRSYVTNRNIQAPAGTPLQALPPALIQLFERAFGPNPSQRPRATEFVSVLAQIEEELAMCDRMSTHVHASSGAVCPWCAVESQTGWNPYPDTLARIPSAQRGSDHPARNNEGKDAEGCAGCVVIMIVMAVLSWAAC